MIRVAFGVTAGRAKLKRWFICGVWLMGVVAWGMAAQGGKKPGQRQGREFCLDSRAGSDQGEGSRLHPWRTLGPLGRVTFVPGDRVLFACGSEFVGGVEVKESGTAEEPIVLQAVGKGAKPRFRNPGLEVLDGNGIRVSGSYVVIEGLFFSECPKNPVEADIHQLGAVFLSAGAEHCVVRGCEMTRTPIGVTVYGEHDVVEGNWIHDDNEPIEAHWGPMGIVVCGSHNEVAGNRVVNYCAPSNEYGHDGGAIEINDRALPKEDIHIHGNLSLRNQGFIEFVGRVKQDNFRIDHNVCEDYQSFIGFTGPCTNILVDHNTVVRTLAHEQDDSEDVVFWNYSDGGPNGAILIRNNIFVYAGLRVEPVFSRGEFDHICNLFYRVDADSIPPQANHAAYVRKYLGGGARLRMGDKIGDPLFRDMTGGDFHLRAGSPAIGMGADLGYERDFDGKVIPKLKLPDVGAFEFEGD
ncbi:MAG TPA: hypothetical protein VFE58_00050 [Tepidisphaeraceae bacterium]|nr:hypothetical protein [Tepidisphaeraceae bacterium]